MTVLKEKAFDMIQRIPDDNMFYVINILENLEAMSKNKKEEKTQAMAAFDDLLKLRNRLPADFDAKRELEKAREEKYGNLS